MAIFSETKAQYYNHVRNTQEKQSLLNRHNPWQVLPFASSPWWPLGQCWGGPYWGAMTDALLMDHIISKLGKGYSFFFFGTFLDVFFQRILDPENRLKTQNRLLKKLQRKSRKNATVAFWETKRPPMWSQTQTWVFLVLVDPWKHWSVTSYPIWCSGGLAFTGLIGKISGRVNHALASVGQSLIFSAMTTGDTWGYLGIRGDTWVGMTGCARFPTKPRLEPRQLPRSFSYSAYCSSL